MGWIWDQFTHPLAWASLVDGSDGKESACNAGDLGLIPGLERSPGGGHANPHQYSGLEISMNYIVHGVTKSRTQLSNFHFLDYLVCNIKFKHYRNLLLLDNHPPHFYLEGTSKL